MLLNLIDFNDPAHLAKVLCQDKHTRIEGICSETAFMEDFFSGNEERVTSGYWFEGEEPDYRVVKLITDTKARLKEIDYAVLDFFSDILPNIPVIVYYNEMPRTFNKIYYNKGQRFKDLNDHGAIVYPRSRLFRNVGSDKTRVDMACNFLNERGLLKDAVISRVFANYYLGKAWDIDFFTATSDGKIVGIEVKHKYSTRHDTFGLNDKEADLFSFLKKKGLPVLYVILEKPVRTPDFPAIKLLVDPEYIMKSKWLVTLFSSEKTRLSGDKAPKETSLYGKSSMRFYDILVDEFRVLKKLHASVPGIIEILLVELE